MRPQLPHAAAEPPRRSVPCVTPSASPTWAAMISMSARLVHSRWSARRCRALCRPLYRAQYRPTNDQGAAPLRHSPLGCSAGRSVAASAPVAATTPATAAAVTEAAAGALLPGACLVHHEGAAVHGL